MSPRLAVRAAYELAGCICICAGPVLHIVPEPDQHCILDFVGLIQTGSGSSRSGLATMTTCSACPRPALCAACGTQNQDQHVVCMALGTSPRPTGSTGSQTIRLWILSGLQAIPLTPLLWTKPVPWLSVTFHFSQFYPAILLPPLLFTCFYFFFSPIHLTHMGSMQLNLLCSKVQRLFSFLQFEVYPRSQLSEEGKEFQNFSYWDSVTADPMNGQNYNTDSLLPSNRPCSLATEFYVPLPPLFIQILLLPRDPFQKRFSSFPIPYYSPKPLLNYTRGFHYFILN